MEYVVGGLLGVGVVLFGRIAGLDRDRAFYPVVLVVVAHYYDLFAVLGGSIQALSVETIFFAIFAGAAVVGFKTNLWVVAAALVAHGMFDLLRGDLVVNPGVPVWWPGFCLTFDVVAGACLGWLLLRSGRSGMHPERASSGEQECSGFRRRIRPHVDAELQAAAAAETSGDAAAAFHHLERAHVLGQASTLEHVRVHVRMLRWGLRQNDVREVLAQLVRILGAATMTAIKAVPHGNTGGSSVSAFRPMPIPDDLAALIATATKL